MKRLAKIFLSGVVALTPLVLTAAIAGWLVSFIASYVGPGSTIGGR